MSAPDPQLARDAVLADLAVLARRRRQMLAVSAAMLAGITVAAIAVGGPGGIRGAGAAIALAVAVVVSLSVALGVPMLSVRAARWGAAIGTALVIGAAGLLGGQVVPGVSIGMGCFAQGVIAGILGLVALTLSMGKLWRRSIDVRWPASLGATAVVLGVGASLCGHPGAIHMWVAHLSIVPAVYALARVASHLVSGRDRLA